MAESASDKSGLDLYDDIVAALHKHDAAFMIVGGFAVIYHGYVRATQDLDLFIRRTSENARRVVAALKEVGGEDLDVSERDFLDTKGVLLGEPPLRVDILSEIAGIDFEEAWSRREKGRFGPAETCFLSRKDLLANKRALGRPRDLDDVRELSNETEEK